MKSLFLRLFSRRSFLKSTLLAGAAPMILPSRAWSAEDSVLVVVMDPLCKELACDCVKGYAQRNYRVLAAYLQQKLGVRVDVAHGETIETALKAKDAGRVPGIIIGKSSVVHAQAKLNNLEIAPIARLTGKNGGTDQFGLIVVRNDSTAKTTQDLSGYRILFGPADCDEKSAAAVALLKDSGVPLPEKLETSSTCATAAEALMQLAADVKAAAVISSYAEPLLQGCGTIKAGDLRVVGRTNAVPFITAFANNALPAAQIKAVTEALLDTGENAELLKIMESQMGFVELESEPKSPVKPGAQWNQFRGPNRDGVAPSLPAHLPAKAEFAWETPLPSDGVGGLAATDDYVIVSGRDSLDQADFFFASGRNPALKPGGSAFPLPLGRR